MDATAFKFLGVGLAMFGTALGAGHGLGLVFSNWLNSIARNPSADGKLRMVGFIGFAGTELVLLMGFVVCALLIFVV